MKKSKKKYITPKITKEEVEINFFWNESRYFDSLVGIEGQLMAACPPSCGCFLPGTTVTLSNNTKKKIESIKPKEKVLSYDTDSAEFVENEVQKLFVHPEEKVYFILNKELFVTGNHRVWTNDLQWKRVDELRIGDTLLTSSREAFIIESIERKKEIVTVYNLGLKEAPHSFFAENLLVHNDGLTRMEKNP